MSKESAPIGKCYKCGADLYATLGLCDSCRCVELEAELEIKRKVNSDLHKENEEFKSKFVMAQTENKRLKKLQDGGYVRHKPNCFMGEYNTRLTGKGCSCGLSQVLKGN